MVTLLGGMVACLSIEFLEIFSWLQSEPLYLALSLGGLILLDMGADRAQRRWPFLAASLLFGLAWLTRYVGIALLAPAIWSILRRPIVSRGTRLLDFVILAAFSAPSFLF
jgi:hypothetical protein